MTQILVKSNSPSDVDIVGLGTITPNKWCDVTPEQEANFLLLNGSPLAESGYETRSKPPPPKKTTKEKEVKDG
jgi:hypothetical protein